MPYPEWLGNTSIWAIISLYIEPATPYFLVIFQSKGQNGDFQGILKFNAIPVPKISPIHILGFSWIKPQ